MKKSYTVRDMPLTERPRERLIKLGPEVLSIPELLAIILGRGVKGKSVIMIAHELIQKYGTLANLATASLEELRQNPGIKMAKATQLKAVFELCKRMQNDSNTCENYVIKSPEDVQRIIQNSFRGKKKEHFMVMSLDTRNHLIANNIISIGSLNASIVHPREVFREAISNIASSVIFVHNHPSGNPEPSEDDIKVTRQLIDAGKLLDIEVLDHIIVSDNSYFSMKAKKLI